MGGMISEDVRFFKAFVEDVAFNEDSRRSIGCERDKLAPTGYYQCWLVTFIIGGVHGKPAALL